MRPPIACPAPLDEEPDPLSHRSGHPRHVLAGDHDGRMARGRCPELSLNDPVGFVAKPETAAGVPASSQTVPVQVGNIDGARLPDGRHPS